MTRAWSRLDDASLIEACRSRSIRLLKRNLTPDGILAASPEPARPSTRLRGDIRAGRCRLRHRHGALRRPGIGACGRSRLTHLGRASGAERTDREVCGSAKGRTGLLVPRMHRLDLVVVDRTGSPGSAARRQHALKRRYSRRIKLAIQWLLAQEHQRFFLLQQNEASDWADIMPRSGFVLYTNTLWYFGQAALPHRARARDARILQRALPSLFSSASPSIEGPGFSTTTCYAADAIAICT
jgi:hypothetical protein